MKALILPFVLFLAIFNVKLGVDHIRAEHAYAGTRSVLSAERSWEHLSPELLIGAFVANMKAHEIYPYDPVFRMQLFRTFTPGWLLGVYRIEPGAADSIYRVSTSAMPDFPGLLVTRMAYLMTVGRCEEECAALAHRLRTVFPYTMDTRRIIAAWKLLDG